MFIKRMLQITLIMAVLAASLAIPRSASAEGPCASIYIVQPGDWLTKIANYCGVSLSALYDANPGVAYQLYIYPGQALNIPGGGVLPVTPRLHRSSRRITAQPHFASHLQSRQLPAPLLITGIPAWS